MNAQTSADATRTDWFKSSRSNPSQSCVEVRFDGEFVHVRDSKYRRNPANDLALEPTITVTTNQWSTFLSELTAPAATAPAGTNGALTIEHTAERTTQLRAVTNNTTLTYTEQEWTAFLAGVANHEFDCSFRADRVSV